MTRSGCSPGSPVPADTKHVVYFSGGITSWAAAKRVAAIHGTKNMVLLFADTKMEDEDLYRFLHQAGENVGAPLITIADGRNPWDVMKDKRIICNSRIDQCSMVLKRKLLNKWRNENSTPETSVHYLGIDWTEEHRMERLLVRVHPWRYEAPMTQPPYLNKQDLLDQLRLEGIEPPRLYAMGFPHNNCGGFCVKAGQAQFALLLRTMPERYAYHEAQEESLREIVGDHSIMKDRRGGVTRPLTMKDFRERMERQQEFDQHEWGGCGCAID